MSITFKVNRRSGDYVKATVVPTNHSDEPHFGALDLGIVVVFLTGAAGLLYLLMK